MIIFKKWWKVKMKKKNSDGYFHIHIKQAKNMHPDKVVVLTHPKNVGTLSLLVARLGAELNREIGDNDV